MTTETKTKSKMAWSGLGALIATVVIGAASQCCTQKQAQTASEVAGLVDCDSIEDTEVALVCRLVQSVADEVAELKQENENGESSESGTNEKSDESESKSDESSGGNGGSG